MLRTIVFLYHSLTLFAEVIFALSSMVEESLTEHNFRMTVEGYWNSGPTCVEFLILLMIVFFKSLFQRCHGEIISRVLWLLLICYQWQLSSKWTKHDGKHWTEKKMFSHISSLFVKSCGLELFQMSYFWVRHSSCITLFNLNMETHLAKVLVPRARPVYFQACPE